MLSQVQLVRNGASCGEGREVVNIDEGEMSGEAGTPSLIDLNKMLGCKLGELCLCLDVCAKVVGGERGDGWGEPRSFHSTVIVASTAEDNAQSHSYRHRYRCRYRYRICSAT